MNNIYSCLSRDVYCSPDCTMYKVNVHRNICQTSPNSTPDMNWDGEYDQEPND